MNKILLSGALSIMSITLNAAEIKNYPVDEDIFLKQAIDFSPPEEKYLDEALLKTPGKEYPFPKSEIKEVDGVLKIVCDGKTVPMLMRDSGATTRKGAPVERMMAENGTNVFVLQIDFHSKLSEVESHAFKMFTERADNILKSVPDAKFIFQLWMTKIGDDFIEQHPDALLTGPDGETKCDQLFARYGKYYYPNMLNEWRRWNAQYLRDFIKILGQSKYASHVMGFYLAAMNTGEWWYYKPTPFVWDYSITRQEAYKKFLNMKYGPKLQEMADNGWFGKSFNSNIFDLPTPEERNQRPVMPCSKVSDYNQVLNLPVTNAAVFFGRVIKTMTSNKVLVGLEMHSALDCFPVNGSVFLSHIFDSGVIDIMGGPADYSDRGEGNSPWFRIADGSLKKHKMLWFNEGDYRFHSSYGTTTGALGEPPATPAGTINVMHREFARMIIKNYYTYLMDFQWYWFFDRELCDELGKLNALQKFMNEKKIGRKPQIALVTDQESQLYSNWYANPTHMTRYFIDRFGCDTELFELRDFLKGDDWKNFNMVIFLNIRALSADERQEIEKLKSDDRMLVFMHDPGIINLTEINPDESLDISKLTGMKLKANGDEKLVEKIYIDTPKYNQAFGKTPGGKLIYDGPENNVVKAIMNKHICIADCAADSYIGNALQDVECIDEEAIKLGFDKSGKCRFGLKKNNGWTSVYTASCLISPAIVRDLAKLAGCHIYLDTDDISFSSGNFVAVHAVSDGTKQINLPRESDVYEIFSGQATCKSSSSFSLKMKTGETALFYLGNSEEAATRIKELEKEIADAKEKFIKDVPAPDVPAGDTEYCSSQAPEKFFSLGSRKNLRVKTNGMMPGEKPASTGSNVAVDTEKGIYPLINLCPSAFLVSGPYKGNLESLLAGICANPDMIKRMPIDKEPVIKANPKADKFLLPLNPLEAKVPDEKNIQWRALSCPLPWVYDYDLGMGKNQTVLIAFFIEGKADEDIEIFFACEGNGKLFFNGKRLNEQGKAGTRGTIVRLSGKKELVTILFSNEGKELGKSGFTCKIFKPDFSLKQGQQIKKHAEDLKIYLERKAK